MIKLEVEDFCHSCKYFEPENSITLGSNVTIVENIVTCKDIEKCRNIKRHIENELYNKKD